LKIIREISPTHPLAKPLFSLSARAVAGRLAVTVPLPSCGVSSFVRSEQTGRSFVPTMPRHGLASATPGKPLAAAVGPEAQGPKAA